jgi:ADP-ribosyl-[dinitrogen reductase] hydrolase
MEIIKDRVKGALIGLACGDAVGTTLEFERRGSFEPISDMVGGGPFKLEPGQWTDDTSMALCLGHSLAHQKCFDPIDQMNRYCNWYQYGYMSSTGDCFDIGVTVSSALRKYLETKNAFSGSIEESASGNGSIMRLAPIPMFYRRDIEECIRYAGESSRTTHGSAECIDSCKFFASLIVSAFSASEKTEIFKESKYKPETAKVRNLADQRFMQLRYEELTGSGYVIESLESAFWCFMHADSFETAILMSANIGNDADTTAAVCGQIAGAFYGESKMPIKWVNKLTMLGEINALADALYELGKK